MSRLLTIEDDETTANDIAVELRKRGFSVDWGLNWRVSGGRWIQGFVAVRRGEEMLSL
jgi:hypothetical protein